MKLFPSLQTVRTFKTVSKTVCLWKSHEKVECGWRQRAALGNSSNCNKHLKLPRQVTVLIYTWWHTTLGTVTSFYAQLHHFMHSYTILCTVTPLYAQLLHFMHSYTTICSYTTFMQLHHFMHKYITLCTVTPLYMQLQTIRQPPHTHTYIYICKSYHNYNDSGCISLYYMHPCAIWLEWVREKDGNVIYTHSEPPDKRPPRYFSNVVLKENYLCVWISFTWDREEKTTTTK